MVDDFHNPISGRKAFWVAPRTDTVAAATVSAYFHGIGRSGREIRDGIGIGGHGGGIGLVIVYTNLPFRGRVVLRPA